MDVQSGIRELTGGEPSDDITGKRIDKEGAAINRTKATIDSKNCRAWVTHTGNLFI